MICDSQQGFELSGLNSCYHEPFHDKIKRQIIGIINGSAKFK